MKNKNTAIAIGIVILTFGVLLAIFAFTRGRNSSTDSTSGLATTLQDDSQIVDEYRDYPFLVQEEWVANAGFDLKKRLYPAADPPGVLRFKPPTEYFEVGLTGDEDRGVTVINIVAASLRSSGFTETRDAEYIDKLFEDGEIEGSYDVIRTLADGRSKIELASSGCLLSASAYEREKLRVLVDILLENCNEVVDSVEAS